MTSAICFCQNRDLEFLSKRLPDGQFASTIGPTINAITMEMTMPFIDNMSWTDIALRLSGFFSLVVASIIARIMLALAVAVPDHAELVVGLAALAVGSTCGGAALFTLGHHLFDEIEISARWMQPPREV